MMHDFLYICNHEIEHDTALRRVMFGFKKERKR